MATLYFSIPYEGTMLVCGTHPHEIDREMDQRAASFVAQPHREVCSRNSLPRCSLLMTFRVLPRGLKTIVMTSNIMYEGSSSEGKRKGTLSYLLEVSSDVGRSSKPVT